MAEDTTLNENSETLDQAPQGGMPPVPPRGGRGPMGGPGGPQGEDPFANLTKSTKTITDENGNEVEVEIFVDADGNEVEIPEPPAMPEGGMGQGGPQGGQGFGGPQGGPGMGGRGPRDFGGEAPEAPQAEGEKAVSEETEEGLKA